jgi:hypothetical protein
MHASTVHDAVDRLRFRLAMERPLKNTPEERFAQCSAPPVPVGGCAEIEWRKIRTARAIFDPSMILKS